jgi:hypothetical protein
MACRGTALLTFLYLRLHNEELGYLHRSPSTQVGCDGLCAGHNGYSGEVCTENVQDFGDETC